MASSATPMGNGGPEEMDFATEIRVRTRRQHRSSNAAVHLTAPLALTSPKVYRLLLKAFYHVFLAIEGEMERLRRLYPKIGAVYFPELLRVKYFERDLEYYYGPDWKTAMGPPSPGTVAWVDRLVKSTKTNPLRIVAYSQTMYGGMFAGGQIIRGWCVRAFGLKGKDGVYAFDFSETIADHSAFQVRYTEALNSLTLTRWERDMLIEEKRGIFERNEALFAELRSAREYQRRVYILLTGIFGFLLVFVWALWTFVQ